MAEYQIDIQGLDGRFLLGFVIECASDDAACAIARCALELEMQAEVWAGARHVGFVSAESGTASSRDAVPVMATKGAGIGPAPTTGAPADDARGLSSWRAGMAW